MLSLAVGFCLGTACDTTDPVSNGDTWQITVTAEPGGSVTQTPPDSAVATGTVLVLTAKPETGYLFGGWSGSIAHAANPCTVVVDRDLTILARFVPLPTGMVSLSSRGRSFTMGSSSALATQDERPPHTVRFSYDFAIRATEVTQGDYARVLGSEALERAISTRPSGIGDSMPVYNVKWYDAALYCNAKSRAEGLDTVYEYSARCADSLGCPYVLENLRIHYDRFGYRLPTEAEWEYACRAGTAGDFHWSNAPAAQDSAGLYAWYGPNANGSVHEIARKRPNDFGLFDMSGNVAEWVADWLAPYPDSAVLDPVGPRHLAPEQFERDWERPVRGGCWELGDSFLRSSSRKGPYATPAAATQPTIGFRTVLGSFTPDTSSRWRPDTGDTSNGSRLVALKSNLIDVIGTAEVKLAFTRTAAGRVRLQYVDFGAAVSTIVTLPDSEPVICPTISPDGRYVAYGTKREGFASGSQVTVRPLSGDTLELHRLELGTPAFLPRWWCDPETGDTFLVYTDGASLNGTSTWETEKTYRVRMNGPEAVGAPEVLWDTGSYHGGLSADGRFLAAGYPRAYVLDIPQKHRRHYFVPTANGLQDSVQVCNVSITPSPMVTDEILLLDFGSSGPSSIVGRPYGLHEVLFICNSNLMSTSHVRRWYVKPAGYEMWNDVEWSNHADFAAGIASNPDTQSVHVIDLADSHYLEIVKGAGLRDPFLWISPERLPQTFDPYWAFARYDLPTVGTGQLWLTKKMKLFWKTREAIQCVIVGSSPAYYGVDPSTLTGRAFNFGVCHGDAHLSTSLPHLYVLDHCPDLKVVCMSLDPGFLRHYLWPTSPYYTGMGDSKGFALDKENGFWVDTMPPAIAAKIEAFDSNDWNGLDTNGYTTGRWGGSWGEPIVEMHDYPFDTSTVQQNIGFIDTLADTLAAHGVHFLVVNFPQNPRYRETDYIGRYGPSRSTYNQLVEWLRALEAENPYFHFYDANAYGEHDYTDEDALDANHLRHAGAGKLGSRIDSLLTTYGVW